MTSAVSSAFGEAIGRHGGGVCYGPGKDGIDYNYEGQRAGRPHVSTPAKAGLVVEGPITQRRSDPLHGGDRREDR